MTWSTLATSSLIRRWTKLGTPPIPSLSSAERRKQQGWLWSQVEDGRIYQALATLAEPSHHLSRTLLPLDQVNKRWEWWHERCRTATWANRYGGGYESVCQLLQNSLDECSRQEHLSRSEGAEKERAQRERLEAAEHLAALEGRAREIEAQARLIAEQTVDDQKIHTAQLQRSTRLSLELACFAAVCAAISFGLFVHTRNEAERADREAINSFISSTWSMFRLPFGQLETEIEALWRLARARPDQKDAFIHSALGNREEFGRLKRRGAEIIRTLGTR